jgi:Ca2+-binding RTX toxin-like protein
MASIPGSHYDIFAPGQTVNFGVTYEPTSFAPPVPGEFNLEVIINATGTGNYPTPPGYQGVLIESVPGKTVPPTVTMLHGNYGLVDAGGNDRIFLGDGSESVQGASGDTLAGGTGLNQFLDAHLGNQSVTGGSGGTETIFGGPGDTIRGGSGGNETIGGRPGDTIIGGSGGNESIDGSQGGQSIVGGTGGNETIWGGPGDTIHGGSGGNETLAGVSGETITGGAANTFFDATAGNDSILAGGGNSTMFGGAHDTVQGVSGGSASIGFAGGNETFWDDGATAGRHDSISTFSQAGGDRVSLNSLTDTPAGVAGTAVTDGSGNTTVTLHDGSTITFIGISTINNTFFTTH